MKIEFWDRVLFLFLPDHLEAVIYEHNLNLVNKLSAERRKVETEKKYTWAKMQKLQAELIAKDQEILKLTVGTDQPSGVL